jgi:predicted Rossmann fold nucleotide-binding protein DprA/Smf involved in DNA uptake
MTSQSRIKFNPATKEFEIEGTEAFVKKYFDKIQDFFVSEKAKPVKVVEENGVSLKAVKKVAKKAKATPAMKKQKAKMGAIQGAILKVFENVKDAVPVKDVLKKTGLNLSQVSGTLLVLKKKGQIKSVGRGMYKIAG